MVLRFLHHVSEVNKIEIPVELRNICIKKLEIKPRVNSI